MKRWHQAVATLFSRPVPAQEEKYGFHTDDPFCVPKLVRVLIRYFEIYNPGQERPTVVICIGTDRSTGDSLGPLVGSKLKDITRGVLHVYGTLDEPVHATNLNETLEAIAEKYKDPFVIAIDACLGRLESVGYISLGVGPLKPGAGVKKDLPPIGNIHLTGIVNVGGYMEFLVLQNTRLSLVMKMANQIASSLFFCSYKIGNLSTARA
ncbi:MAG: spore protease YyaC [Firmicutes bacterium]|nr:spore protease YyaC [Bacillota bacterium]